MSERISPRQLHEAVGVEDWRVVSEGACAYFTTGSFGADARLVRAIGELSGLADHHPDLDLRTGGVTVRLITITHDAYGLIERDITTVPTTKGENVSEQDVFILSERALANVIGQIGDDQWDQRHPEWFQTGGQGDATLRQIVNYHAYDSAWVPDVLAGKTMAEVGDRYEFLKTSPNVNYRDYSERAIAAAAALDDPDRIVHLSYGAFPAREYLKHVTSFRGFRAFDIAKWIGTDTRLPDDLVRGMWVELVPEIEAWRAIGVFGPAVSVPEDAPLQDKLLGLAGRDPSAA